MSTEPRFDRHPFDDALTHNAQLKVGGLETETIPEAGPIHLSDAQEAVVKKWAADDRLWTTQETVEFNLRVFARNVMKAETRLETPCELKQHAGDCTIYRALINGRPYDGICTCGYGWELVRKSDYSEMLSGERMGALMQATIADPNKPSQWATKAETRIMQLAGIPGIENFSVAVEIQHAIDQACAEKDELRVMQLAAISTASNQNTENTVKDRIGFDHPYCSTAYQDVCRAVDREMALRKACAERDAEIARLKDELRVYEERNSVEINLVADALAKKDLEIALLKADRSALLDGSNVTKLQEQNAALRALLEQVPHENFWAESAQRKICHPNCLRCAYEQIIREAKTQA